MIPALVAFFVLILGVLVIHSACQFAAVRARQRAKEWLLVLARRLSFPERLDGGLMLKFERRGFPAAVSVHLGARLNVEVSFRLTGEDEGWLSVSSMGLKRALLEQFGLKDFQVGDPAFDDRFEVWGRDEAFVRRKLHPEIWGLLSQVDRRWDFVLRLTQDRLSLRSRIAPLDRYQMETLTGVAFQILDLLDLRSPADFVFSKVQEKLSDDTRCPVCGTPLSRGSIVRCSKCRAAHHTDCWQFNGLCATFACGGREKKAA